MCELWGGGIEVRTKIVSQIKWQYENWAGIDQDWNRSKTVTKCLL